jgi:hypothetical protein
MDTVRFELNFVTRRRWVGLWMSAACWLVGVTWAHGYRYAQKIEVPRAGLVRVRLPAESMEKASCNEEFRLFSPDGEELPRVIETAAQGVRFAQDPPSTQAYKILDDHSVLTFSVNGRAVDGFEVAQTGKMSPKRVRVEQSDDGARWRVLFERVFPSWLRVGFPTTRRTYFRLTFDDRDTPPLSGVRARLRAVPSRAAVPELMPVDFTQTSTGTTGLLLEMTPPSPAGVTESVEIALSDLGRVNLYGLTSGHRSLVQGTERLPSAQGGNSLSEIYCPAQGKPVLVAVWGGHPRVGDRWLGFIPTEGGVSVESVRARVQPYFLMFHADRPGTYMLRFGIDGPATDPVLIYGERQRSLRQTVAAASLFVGGSIAPIQLHSSIAAVQALPEWDPLPGTFDASGYAGRSKVQILKDGFQFALVPANLAGLSHVEGDDWRIVSGGREIPFLIRREDRVLASITHRVRPLPDRGDVDRWELTGTFAHVGGIYIQASVSGMFRERTARIVEESGLSPRRVLAEETWAMRPDAEEGAREAGAAMSRWSNVLRLVLKEYPKGNTLILEVEGGQKGSLNIEDFSIGFRPKTAVFKATSGDDVWFYFGRAKAPPASYAIRRDPRSGVTLAETRAVIRPDYEVLAGSRLPAPVGPLGQYVTETLPTSAANPASAAQRRSLAWGVLGFLGGVALVLLFRVKKK